MTLVSAVFAFVVTTLLMFVLRPVAREIGLIDIPGGRKRHGVAVPLIGGLAMSVAIGLASSFSTLPDYFIPVLLAVYLLAFVGTVDDRFDIPAGVRLIAQCAAAMLVVMGGGLHVWSLDQAFFFTVNLGPFATLFSLLFIVTIINAFNVIDGIDGLAGCMILLALACLAIVGSSSDVFGLAVIGVGAVAAFLIFNLPIGVNKQIRSFMGDAGSTALGLIIAATGIAVTQDPVANVSPVVGLWFVAVPVYDLFSAALRRVMEKRSPFAPDHEHMHHALMEAGISARMTLVFMVGWAVSFAVLGLLAHYAGASDGLMLVSWCLGLVLFYQCMRQPGIVARFISTMSGRQRVSRQ